jgi:hypothetical protein
MTIRKTGSATGIVTGVEQDHLRKAAGLGNPGSEPWEPGDETALADENRLGDLGDPDERRE